METSIALGTSTDKAIDKTAKPRDKVRRRDLPRRHDIRTVLVASVGWPTEATLPEARKRSAKR